MTNEFDFIQRLRDKQNSALRTPHSALTHAIGDDAAIIKQNSKTDFVISTDMLVEDIDFRLDWTKPKFLGHKALAVSLSDIAAMGARPLYSLLSIGVPKKIWRTKFLDEFYEGWFALAKKYNVQLIGGDVSRTTEKIVIDSIVIGETKRGKAVLRSGANVGDLIFVTGELGGAAAGLKLLESLECDDLSSLLNSRNQKKNCDKSQHSKLLLLKQLCPDTQVEIGAIIGNKNLATAMIDISDGLSSDLNHLCNESNVGAIIEADKIPTIQFSNKDEELNFALNGGEDFELLFTVKPNKLMRLKNALANFSITQIGVITEKNKNISIVINGRKKVLKPRGFVHF
jgi:thiamine-monophosphate kinase